jgi:chorismate synthase
VEVGLGLATAARPGSQVHDPILYDKNCRQFTRPTNHAGGIEGGNTNGEPVVARAAMKPIPTLRRGLATVDFETGAAVEAQYQRSDVTSVPAASVVGEAMVALELTAAFLERFGGDSFEHVRAAWNDYVARLAAL